MSKKIWLLPLFAAILAAAFWYHAQNVNQQSLVASDIAEFSGKVQIIRGPKSGVQAYLLQSTENPIVSLSFLFADAGYGSDADGALGLSVLTAQMLTEGTASLTAADFKEKTDNLAIGIDYDTDKDDFSGNLLTTKQFLPEAADLLRQTLTAPRLDAEDLARIKEKTLLALRRQQENPSNRLALAAASGLYGNHPYARNPLGKAEDIVRITPAQIADFVKQKLGRDNLLVGIAGDIFAAEAEQLLDEVFGALPERGAVDALPPAEVDFTAPEQNLAEDLPQSLAYFAAPACPMRDAEFYPLYIANYIFGGAGLSSWLNMAAREKEGLTYGIYSGISNSAKADLLVGSYSSTPQNFARVKEILREKWRQMGQNGITVAELAEAKSYLIGSYNLRFADTGNISTMLVAMQRNALGADFLQKRNHYVQNVTLQQVNAAAKKYFKPENLRMINLVNLNSD